MNKTTKLTAAKTLLTVAMTVGIALAGVGQAQALTLQHTDSTGKTVPGLLVNGQNYVPGMFVGDSITLVGNLIPDANDPGVTPQAQTNPSVFAMYPAMARPVILLDNDTNCQFINFATTYNNVTTDGSVINNNKNCVGLFYTAMPSFTGALVTVPTTSFYTDKASYTTALQTVTYDTQQQEHITPSVTVPFVGHKTLSFGHFNPQYYQNQPIALAYPGPTLSMTFTPLSDAEAVFTAFEKTKFFQNNKATANSFSATGTKYKATDFGNYTITGTITTLATPASTIPLSGPVAIRLYDVPNPTPTNPKNMSSYYVGVTSAGVVFYGDLATATIDPTKQTITLPSSTQYQPTTQQAVTALSAL